MKAPLLALSMFCGVVLTVHLAMNGVVGVALNNARVGNAMFWCIGAVMALVIGYTGWQSGTLSGLGQVNPLLFTAGAIGATLVFAIAWLIPEVGAGPFTFALLAGQIVSAMILSHYGWLGSPVQKVNLMNVIGAVVMFVGVYLTTRR
jgi:bacterial/archaeal transporter family-2 protein